MVYDALRQGRVDTELAHQLLAAAEPSGGHRGGELRNLRTGQHDPSASRCGDPAGSRQGLLRQPRGHRARPPIQLAGAGERTRESWLALRDLERIAKNITPAAVSGTTSIIRIW
jgi:hypothetical protein